MGGRARGQATRRGYAEVKYMYIPRLSTGDRTVPVFLSGVVLSVVSEKWMTIGTVEMLNPSRLPLRPVPQRNRMCRTPHGTRRAARLRPPGHGSLSPPLVACIVLGGHDVIRGLRTPPKVDDSLVVCTTRPAVDGNVRAVGREEVGNILTRGAILLGIVDLEVKEAVGCEGHAQ